MHSRRRVARALCLGVVLGLAVAACDPTNPTNVVPDGPTTTTGPTTTAAPTTTTLAPTTTTAAPTTTTTTTTTVPSGGGGGTLTRTDTGYTHVRVDIASQAAWVTVNLNGTNIEASKTDSTTGNSQVTGLGGNQIAIWGDGTVSLELVLSIAPSASTSLSMCKNYLGPATVNITRLTDGAHNVASFTDAGTNPVVPSGSCENYAQTSLSRSALIGPVRWPARRDARPLVLANYYPWYDPTTLANTNFGDQPIGPANTNDPAVVLQAVDLARGSGIDGFIVEYEATPANGPRIDYAFNAADQRPGFQMGLMLDLDLLYRRYGSITTDMLDAALDSVASHASHPSQLTVNGKPVVFIYGSTRVTPTQWNAALDRLSASTGVTPFVIADDPSLGSPGRYIYGTNNLSTNDQLQGWATSTVHDMQLVPGLYNQLGPLWVAPTSPGYDDTRLGRQQSTYVSRNGGVRYDQEWNAALLSLPDWVLITTWNEYYEQTHIAPGSTTGYQALQQTSGWAGSFHQTG